jgi:hypothetical protein
MASPDSFAAQYRPGQNQVTLNGLLIDRSRFPAAIQSFLEHHELFHALAADAPDAIQRLGLSEENCADLFALYALQKGLESESAVHG